LFSTRSLKC